MDTPMKTLTTLLAALTFGLTSCFI
ncbi:peptidase, partial [Pseudomonas syringae]|nr:peptidase [Pseudomonas syringae]